MFPADPAKDRRNMPNRPFSVGPNYPAFVLTFTRKEEKTPAVERVSEDPRTTLVGFEAVLACRGERHLPATQQLTKKSSYT